jgi:hypothetical protein
MTGGNSSSELPPATQSLRKGGRRPIACTARARCESNPYIGHCTVVSALGSAGIVSVVTNSTVDEPRMSRPCLRLTTTYAASAPASASTMTRTAARTFFTADEVSRAGSRPPR